MPPNEVTPSQATMAPSVRVCGCAVATLRALVMAEQLPGLDSLSGRGAGNGKR